MNKVVLGCLTAAVLSLSATSQVELNEIFAHQLNTDDQEFIELKGTPNLALTNYMVLIVEGDLDSSSGVGLLDRAWDLSAFTIPADGFFVLGDTAVANRDLELGPFNSIENGTETFYLVRANSAADVATILGMVGTDVDPDGDLTTVIPSLATIVDLITMVDADAGDRAYDGARTVGPDGPDFPAGIFRGNDASNDWCGGFLDFALGTNLERTPGVANILCCHPDQGMTASGAVELSICGGPLVTGNRVDLGIAGGSANQGGILIFGDTFVGIPLLGATFGPVPILVSVPVALDANGKRSIPNLLETSAALSGLSAYVEVLVLESVSPSLVLGSSNTVRLDFQ